MDNNYSRFGVPTPSVSRSTMTQPKPKNKFRLQFFGLGGQKDGWTGKRIITETNTVDLPKLSYKQHNMYRYDTETSYLGRFSWSDVTLSLRDTVKSDLLASILGQNQKAQNYARRLDNVSVQSRDYKFEMWIQALVGSERVYDVISQVGGVIDDAITIGTAVAGASDGSITDMALAGLSADTTDYFQGTICTWVLEGCVIKNYDFGAFDYADSNFNTIELTIKPDTAYILDDTGSVWYDPGFALNNIQGIINDPSTALGGLI